jgi:hypothetical protein
MEAEMTEQESANSDGTTKRVVRATVASAVSALIAYTVRKAAPMLREKLQSVGDGSVPETLGKAKDVVGQKVEAATSVVTDRIGSGSSATNGASTISNDELEKRHTERAQHRSERQKALTS